jgi:hypothetical protein
MDTQTFAGLRAPPHPVSGRICYWFCNDLASGWIGNPALSDRHESKVLDEILSSGTFSESALLAKRTDGQRPHGPAGNGDTMNSPILTAPARAFDARKSQREPGHLRQPGVEDDPAESLSMTARPSTRSLSMSCNASAKDERRRLTSSRTWRIRFGSTRSRECPSRPMWDAAMP